MMYLWENLNGLSVNWDSHKSAPFSHSLSIGSKVGLSPKVLEVPSPQLHVRFTRRSRDCAVQMSNTWLWHDWRPTYLTLARTCYFPILEPGLYTSQSIAINSITTNLGNQSNQSSQSSFRELIQSSQKRQWKESIDSIKRLKLIYTFNLYI